MIEEAIKQLLKKQDLSLEIAKAVMDEMMNGIASPVQVGAYLTALAMKGETIEELTASAAGMRDHSVHMVGPQDLLEFAGTSNNGSNIFTLASFIIEAAGIKVAKPGKIAAMKHVDPICEELGIRTIFDILKPLTSPAGANIQIVNVHEEELVEPIARVLLNLGVKRAMVVYGQDDSDGISVSAPTMVCEIKHGQLRNHMIEPEQFGMNLYKKEDLISGASEETIQILERLLEGEQSALRDAVVINAGAGLYVTGVSITLEAGIEFAQEILGSDKVEEKLKAYIDEFGQ